MNRLLIPIAVWSSASSRRHILVCTMKCHLNNTEQERLNASQYPCNAYKNPKISF
jgi:hypothetical protein